MSPDHARPDDTFDYLIEDPVELIDGVHHLRLPSGPRPLRLGDAPVTSFAPGWRPCSLFLGFAPLLLLEFRNENNGVGYWLLDHNLRHISSSVSDLSGDLRDLLRSCAVPILREIIAVVDRAAPAPLGAAAEAFLRLGGNIKHQIAAPFTFELFVRPTIYPVADLVAGQAPLGISSTGERYWLSGSHLMAGFEPDWQGRLIEAARTGTLSWPSPVDGRPLPCRGSLIFDDFVFAYRFVDEHHELTFYVLASEHNACCAGVWFPCSGVLVVRDDAARPLGDKLRQQLSHRLLDHLLNWALLLRPYFACTTMHLSNLLRGDPAVHIGHQLWNELTGIEGLLDLVPAPRLTHLVLGRGGRYELYGPIDEIFPPLEGHVRRDLGSLVEMMADSYRSGRIVFRITRDYVSARLRSRLVAHACREAAGSVRIPAGPILMIGLRVENRTLADPDGFLGRLVAMIDRAYPALNLVFDGHNSNDGDGKPISSNGESLASIAPDEVERGIVDRLRQRFPHRRDRLFDTIMHPVSTSLVWAHASMGFVSIWGASLAKYRWVANLPGFVISSANNLRHRHDLNIYHSPRYMEHPSPMEFVAPDLVVDMPDAPQLVSVGGNHPSFSNFDLNEPLVLDAILSFVEARLDEELVRSDATPQGT